MSQKNHFSHPNRTVAMSVSFSPIHTTKADEPVPNKWRCGVLTPFLEAKPSCKIDYGFRIIDYGFRITDYGFRITYYSALWCHPTTQIGWIFSPLPLVRIQCSQHSVLQSSCSSPLPAKQPNRAFETSVSLQPC